MQVVLADAGPLIGLARIQQLQLLSDLFDTVWITPVIAAELGAAELGAAEPSVAPLLDKPVAYPGSDRLREAWAQGWLQIASEAQAGAEPYQPLNPGVDAGEASAIGYALQQTATGARVLLLIDDRCGRAEARRQGLAIIGTAAVLVLAKERGLVAACAPLLDALRSEGYYLSDSLVAAVLQQAGEPVAEP